MTWQSGIYAGTLTHHRVHGPSHRFGYPLYLHLLDLDELDSLDARLRLFGRNRRRPVQFRDADHLWGPEPGVRDRLRALLAREGVAWPGGRVRLLTHCRVFGYVFNPVSFYYCHDTSDRLAVIVAEVNNTFGDRHPYVLPVSGAERLSPDGRDGARYRWTAKKLMHVSPFFPMDGSYRWEFDVPGDRLRARVDVTLGGALQFTAGLSLRRVELSDRALAAALVKYPFVTLKVIGAIHWEALRLWLKGAPFRSQPPYDPEAARQGVS